MEQKYFDYNFFIWPKIMIIQIKTKKRANSQLERIIIASKKEINKISTKYFTYLTPKNEQSTIQINNFLHEKCIIIYPFVGTTVSSSIILT